MHGYQLMQAMAERTNGVWRPSPGAIYPTIAQLEDEGLVTTLAEGGRKLVTLTDAGRAYLADNAETLADPFAALIGTPGQSLDLRSALEEIHAATRALSRNATEAQAAAAYAVLERDPPRALPDPRRRARPQPASAESRPRRVSAGPSARPGWRSSPGPSGSLPTWSGWCSAVTDLTASPPAPSPITTSSCCFRPLRWDGQLAAHLHRAPLGRRFRRADPRFRPPRRRGAGRTMGRQRTARRPDPPQRARGRVRTGPRLPTGTCSSATPAPCRRSPPHSSGSRRSYRSTRSSRSTGRPRSRSSTHQAISPWSGSTGRLGR